MQSIRPSFFDASSLRLLLFGGKGGVGKTTCATAAALRLASARPRDSFLLVSIDPAHSLVDSLAGSVPPANLQVLELDASECLSAFRAMYGQTLREIAAAGTFLDDEDVGQFLRLSLPGLDELMAFLRVSDWVEDGRYACIVVDTAPSGHTLKLLEMPGLLQKWVAMLDALLAKRRYMRMAFSRCGQVDRLDRFIANWSDAIAKVMALLNNPAHCEFVPVTIPEPLSVRETIALRQDLTRFGIASADLVVNQLHRPGLCPACSEAYSLEKDQIRKLMLAVEPTNVWAIDLLEAEVRGTERLERFWENARLIELSSPGRPLPVLPKRPPDYPAPLPLPETNLIMFAGKGGVGKTTLACATALRLARELPNKRLLLVSTQSGHSLSACLATDVGAQPTLIVAGLSAVEIDSPAFFQALKAGYASDVEQFLQSVSTRFDLTFDRVVFEKLMDLAPPGLEEVTALARILELLSSRRYDLLVLDSAPTGHFLRLMQLPSLINQWLRAFFQVLIKYQRVIELPNFAGLLVDLSKNLKKFRALVSDPARTILYAVSIPTEMALEETRDLLRACDTLGIPAQSIFLNRITPPGKCQLCEAVRRRELQVAGDFQKAFPRQPQVLVYRQGQPTGLERLEELSRGLFVSRREPMNQQFEGTICGRISENKATNLNLRGSRS